MPKLASSLERYPARITTLAFLLLVVGGGCLLGTPACSASSQKPITWLDAFFTSTSAVCVTGLSVRSTVDDFSLIGQIVILSLIQLGGIGIMTFTSFIMLTLGGAAGLRQQVVLTDTLGGRGVTDVRGLVRRVFFVTLTIELIGAFLLWVRFSFDMPWRQAGWYAIFHSVSAFCNAGFGLWNDSLIGYRGDWLVNLVICGLVILGGLGFPVLLEILNGFRSAQSTAWTQLSLHAKLVLISTFFLVVFGYVTLTILEWDNGLKDATASERILIPFFHSVICRTAGFNSIDLNDLTNASLFVSILLMAIGGAPCSTEAGDKTTPISMLVLNAIRRFQGFRNVSCFRKTIPQSAIERAAAATIVFFAIAVFGCLVLMLIEQSGQSHRVQQDSFMDLLFEVVSALGTVGLSTGITPTLSPFGKIVIMLLMFLGRLGPVSVMVAMSRTRRPPKVEYAHEEPLFG
ncbi:MAG: TrkH family potassium uptake protein [Planctomycetota bacterium]